MNLLDTIKGLGHYAKNTWNAVKKPLAYVAAATIILTTFDANEAKAQDNNFKNTNMEVTETGYGNLFIKNEENNGVDGATITWTPVTIPGDSIPDPYVFISNNVGISAYEVLVFHDTGVGVQNQYNIEVVQTRPNPSTDFTFNFIANERPNNAIQVNDVNGKLVGRYDVTNYDNHVAVYHVDLSDKADRIYFATATIDGKPQVSKIVKINGAYSGNLGYSAKPIPINLKIILENEAIYDITIEADGYYTLTDQRIVTEGDQGTDFYTLISDEEPPIDNLDIEGYVWQLENTSNTLENVDVKVTVNSNGDEYITTSDSNGYFVVNDLPLGETITFDIGGLTSRYSFTGVNFTTPEEIANPADSVNSNFSAVLPLKLASSSAQHIKDQSKSGTQQQVIEFYLGNSFNETQKNTIRNYFLNFEADEGGIYDFEESATQLTNSGINIEYGTYNTSINAEAIETPLGETFYPILYANSTMGVGNYFKFVHEIKRGIGFAEVAWAGVESVMETPVQNYTLEDKEIAEFVERPYWNAVYQEEKTWIKTDNISEDMNSKSPNSNVSNNDLNQFKNGFAFKLTDKKEEINN